MVQPSPDIAAMYLDMGLWLCRYVCLYDVEDKMLLRRVQISSNRSLDGVLDQLNSKDMTDAGPAQLLADAASDEDELLPPTTAGAAPRSILACQKQPEAPVCYDDQFVKMATRCCCLPSALGGLQLQQCSAYDVLLLHSRPCVTMVN